MTPLAWIEYHDAMYAKARALTVAKGHDYSGTEDTLTNLKACERLGLCPAETGVLIRLSDKFQRLITLIGKDEAPVVDESVEDTMLDIVNYTLLLGALRKERIKEMPCSKE